MAMAREHFALDWIKADLLETLNDARIALDDYAEQGREETRMRACLTGLHQVHGTLVMLGLKGVTQLADHLEQLAQAMMAKSIADEVTAGQALMQGILELPGYLDELQRGAEDSVSTSMSLVNEIRGILDQEPLVDPAGASLREGASDEVIARFNAIGGPEKVARIRSAYQSVLLSILKGEDRSSAVGTLAKIAVGLEKVSEGAPLARQWQAFGEFITALTQHTGVLESEAVKLLRRVDLEIKNLAKDGEAALRQPVNMELVEQLLDAAVARENTSDAVAGLQKAVARDVSNNTLAISGRQAMGSAAEALQEDLNVVKDKLDLLVRAEAVDLEELRLLVSPLKQIGSTLSLLGFESSREIVSDQVDAIENLAVMGDVNPQSVTPIAGALVQIDENLSSVVLGSGQTEIEQITSEAQLQLLREARKDLDQIKQCIVDFVTAHWSLGHLEPVSGKIADIVGALEIIPLARAVEMLGRVNQYVTDRLMQGHRPEWQELDQFADVISAIDYYLERLADETGSGTDDILTMAERSLNELGVVAEVAGAEVAGAEVAGAEVADVGVVEADVADIEPVADETEAVEDDVDAFAIEDAAVTDEVAVETAPAETPELDVEEAPSVAAFDAVVEDEPQFAMDPVEQAVTETETETETEAEAEEEGEPVTEFESAEAAEPKAEPEDDLGFDLGSNIFAGIEGAVDAVTDAPEEEPMEQAVSESPVTEVERPDDEIVEIFVEEVDEVLETIGEYLPQWSNGFDNTEALTEVRRAFHTLKGSGRIVNAAAIGELAWGVENMLNRVMDDTVQPNEQFVSVIDQARNMVPGLRDEFAQGRQGDLDAIGHVIEQADILASGGELDLAQEPLQKPEQEASTDVADAIEDEQLPPVEQVDEASDLEPAALEDATSEDLGLEIAADVDDDAWAGDTIEDEPSTEALFVAEMQEHLAVVAQENAQLPWRLSDPMARAFHTFVGAAALAEQDQFHLIAQAADQVVEAYRNAEPSEELAAFFKLAETHLNDCLTALVSNQDWEEPLDFVAAADDLLAVRGSAPRAVDQLLNAPSVAALFDLEDEYLTYLTAAERGEPTESMESVQSGLTSLAQLLADTHAQALVSLSTALERALADAAELPMLPVGASTILRAAYNKVLDQLNELAVGSELGAQDELITALASIDFTAPVETTAEPELEAVQPPTPSPVVEEAESAEESAVQVSGSADLENEESSEADAQQEIAELAEIDPDLVQVFFEEADEISEELEAGIVGWSDERDNRVYMETLLRGLHTLKGGARLCGLMSLGDMAHDFESVVIEVQNNERAINDELFTQLNQRYDEITARVAEVAARFTGEAMQEEPTAAPAAEPENVVSLEVSEPELPAQETLSADAATLADDLPPVEEEASADEADAQPLQLDDVNKVVEAVVTPIATPDSAEKAATATADETAAKTKKSAPDRSSQEMVRVSSSLLEELVNLAGESSILRARVEQGMSDFTVSLDEMETTIERLREQLRRLEIETETQILYRHERHDGPQYENFDPLEMDRYNQLQQLSRSLSESASDMLDLKETLLYKARESETLLLQQARINTEIQEGLMRTRMVPFSRLLPRLRRIVRQVAGELDKEVGFHVQNGEGELDRNLLERMVPPLEHMLRNAVDHGIEDVEMRRNFGKAAKGRVDLRLTREGGDVVIEISDDGAGIDVESVRQKAIERGLMSADADLGDEEVLQFVLAAGFSTAKSVTQISGRGVGLDVVASEVKQLGGSVNIVSRQGKGTRFVVRVPFTVSVNRALMVSVSDDLYAIPLNNIEGIVLLSQDQLQALYSSDSKTFEYAGVPYRVRYLGQYLGREYHGPGAGNTSVPVVLVRSGDHAVAIHVDQVQGSREIVVKSLGPQFAGVGGISGATILGDGSVVVILDLLALIRAQQFEKAQRAMPGQGLPTGPRCVMVVDDSVTVRKVTSRLLERQGMDVLVAKDGVEAVALLQERRPDVMLLDIEMPRMDGFEVARQVRHDDRLVDLPIVMISSRTGDKHKEHANQLGVNRFLGKPFQENELLATIDELVTRT